MVTSSDPHYHSIRTQTLVAQLLSSHLTLLLLHHILGHLEGAQVLIHVLDLRVLGGVLATVQQLGDGVVVVVDDVALLAVLVVTCGQGGVMLTVPSRFSSLLLQLLDLTHGSCGLHLVLEELLCAKLEDVVQFLFGHGAGFRAQAGSNHQVGQHHFPLCHLSDSLFH